MRIQLPAVLVGIASFLIGGTALSAADSGNPPVPGRWTAERAWEWYRKQPWLVGCNFLPSTAVNDVEMWQRETFDPATIDRELSWAAGLGFNTVRVFVNYVVWETDADGLKQRLARFLEIADKHHIATMPILFDDCFKPEPHAGKQEGPIPGVHNSQWVQSPGARRRGDPKSWPMLEKYIKDMVGAFGRDRRIVVWDLYNEPSQSLPLVEAAFRWAREAGPSQPLTTCIFGPPPMARRIPELCDVVSFHHYGPLPGVKAELERLKAFGRPILCTEWMARGAGSRFETHLPLFKKEKVGCWNWGLVAGRTQTYYLWGSKPGSPEPSPWHHDLLRRDGKPYSEEEVRAIRLATESIAVVNPRTLPPGPIPCERIPLGVPDDYKPCLAILPSGELLLTAFHQHKREANKVLEQVLLFRSSDGGRTWTKPEGLPLLGREPYLTVLKDGTIFLTGHLLAGDVRNKFGYTHGYVHRSTDGGRTWHSTRITSEEIRPKAANHSSRNVIELSDGTLLLGVDYDGGGGPYFMWRSKDRGNTWDRTPRSEPVGFKSRYGFFQGEAWLWLARSGKILALVRVDSNDIPIAGRPLAGQDDQDDHFMLWESRDAGRTFHKVQDLGDYGEMYMSVLRLRDKRLLLTFTVRKRKPPLGVRAVLGVEHDDGFTFDFDHDRLMLDTKTGARYQGGGFGPTVQLADETLVTCCSYRGQDEKTHLEVIRWRLPGGK